MWKSFPVAAVLLSAATVLGQPQPDEAQDSESAASLARMRQKAEEFSVAFTADAEQEVTLRPEPVFRYSDLQHHYKDATVWVWEAEGAPVAIAKVEDSPKRGMWQYCVASLSEELISVNRPGQPAWTATEPGVTFRPIVGDAMPQDSPVRRLTQMRALSRRFEGTFVYGPDRSELRPLPAPIHRFSAPDAGITDGAIFSFAISATNPTALVVIAQRQDADDSSETLHYAVVGMTAERTSVRLDDVEVWSKETNYRQRFYENWYFHTERRGPDE